jgi:GNAT superfamily N-acetyltransferase
MGKIRKINKKDINQVVDLMLDLYKVHSKFEEVYRIKSDAVCLGSIKKDLRRYFTKQKKRTILVYEENNKIIAFADFWTEKRSCYVRDKGIWIYEIYVNKDYRKRGIAMRLVKEIAKMAKKKGIEEIDLTYVPKNIMSLGFWRHLKAKIVSVNAVINTKDVL